MDALANYEQTLRTYDWPTLAATIHHFRETVIEHVEEESKRLAA